MKRIVLIGMLLVMFLYAGLLTAQQTTARVIGVVQSEDGSPVPGVSVEATSPKLVGKTTALTTKNGTFRLMHLTPGIYKLVFSLPGYQTVVRENIQLKIEQTLNLKITMNQGNSEEVMNIVDQSLQLDVRSTAKSMVLSRDEFQTLPKGRNFDSLATVAPGVSNESLLLGGLSIDGASGLENMFYIDGTDTTNIKNGSSGQNVSFDFVDEVQVKSSGYNAEFGGALGGVINIVTRSGGNEFHGEALGYYSGAPLRGKNRDVLQLDRDDNSQATYYPYDIWYGKDNENRYEGGLNLGGYIVKDKLWFFGSVMPVYYTNTRTVNHFDGNIRDWQRSENTMNFQVKLTAQPLKNLRLGASLVNNFSKWKGDVTDKTAIAAGDSNPEVSYNDYGFSFPNIAGNFNAELTLGNNFILSLRAGYFRTNQNNQLVAPNEPCWQFMDQIMHLYEPTTNIDFLDVPESYQRSPGYTNYSRANSMVVNKNINKKISAGFDLSYFMNLGGEHSWKAGLAWGRRGQDVNNTAQYPIIFFAWDRSLFKYTYDYNRSRGKYGYYAVRGNDVTGPYGDFYNAFSNTLAVYLQDSWTIANKFTLNFGVRAESEAIPSYATGYPDFEKLLPIKFGLGDKISPRLGLVWDVKGDSTLKVFGSYGIFYDTMKLEMAAGYFGGTHWKSTFYKLDTYEWNKIGVDGYFPGENMITLDFHTPSFDSFDPDIKPMTQQEISLGLEKRLRQDLSLSVRLVNKHLLWAIEDIGVVLPGLGEMYYIANPGGQFIQDRHVEAKAAGYIPANAPAASKAKRDYYAVNIAVDKRFADNWQGGISYTFSSLRGNYNGLASGDEVGLSKPYVERYFDNWYVSRTLELKDNVGPLPGDRPHYLKAYGSYSFPFGVTAGLVFNAMSGSPTSTEWLMDYPGYMPYGRGDQKRSPMLMFANLYLEYNLKLGKNNLNINVNVDNVTDTKTAQRIFPVYNRTIPQGLTDQRIADGPWKIEDYKVLLDPRYLKEYLFYGPLQARLGLRFSF